jgi:CelD/BcsL family acetyltransferase involved in cellulose biosynthesis
VAVYKLDPLQDCRWGKLLDGHPSASVFHTPAWLETLRRTYGYVPVVLTTNPPGAQLSTGLVCCRVNSWLTGKRLVSLPFSDYCQPLVDNEADLYAILSALEQELHLEKLLYAEVRPMQKIEFPTSLRCSSHSYCLHRLDLKPDLDTLFSGFHKGSTQRKVRRAQREGLTYEEGRQEFLLDAFYRLLLLTRRRHGLPPQPRAWFQNLIDCFGEALKIRLAFKNSLPVASILTLRHKRILLYKYGCSDERFHNLGGMHLLFWRAIQEAKNDGLSVLDFGRSDLENAGLVKFKDRWGGTRSILTYCRFSASNHSRGTFAPAGAAWYGKGAQRILSRLPSFILRSAGDLLYRHLG